MPAATVTKRPAAAKKTSFGKAASKPVVLGKHADKHAADAWVPPPFTLKDVRNCIPAHCFERNTLRSFGYVAHDAILASILFYAALYIPTLPYVYQAVAWPAYWIAQGIVCTGLWVIAHECGHQAFSPSATVNNTVGYILHTCLLVPYYAWKYTHSKHHKANCNMAKDQVFIPTVRSKVDESTKKRYTPEELAQAARDHDDDLEHELTEVAPLFVLWENVRMLLFGWPAYMLINASSQKYGAWASHFKPSSGMFDPKHRAGVIASNIGLVAFISFLFYLGQVYGSLAVIAYYVIPYLMVNGWLVCITYLQHTSPVVPHFRDNEWDFLRGALSTVDRDYGILNYFHHHIADTHVVHHLFSTMPHYHAEEATEAVKKFLGKYYLYDNTPIWRALYESQSKCRFVEDTGDVLFFKY